MALQTTITAVEYDGNNSTEVEYPVPFPFLDTIHIYVAHLADGEQVPVVLDQTQYQVTRLPDGSGGSVLTNTAYPPEDKITVFRVVPLTQPTTYPTAGIFPAETHETALDRLTMVCQQLRSDLDKALGIDSSSVIVAPGQGNDLLRDVLQWEDAAERATVRPARRGQLGVQMGDMSLWMGLSNAVGDWGPMTESQPDAALIIGFLSDTGATGPDQQAAKAWLDAKGTDVQVFGGNGSGYSGGSVAVDWAEFLPYIDAETAYTAMGWQENEDLITRRAQTLALFDHVPQTNGGRYYSVTLGNGLVELFVLNCGVDQWSVDNGSEPDGIGSTSTQADNIRALVDASNAVWKIAVFHLPVVKDITAGVAMSQFAWVYDDSLFDLVLNGAHFSNSVTDIRGTAQVVAGASTQALAADSDTDGTGLADARHVWQNNLHRAGVALRASTSRLHYTVENIENEAVIYSDGIGGIQHKQSSWDWKILDQTETQAALTYYVAHLPQAFRLSELRISMHVFAEAGVFDVAIDGNSIGTFVMDAETKNFSLPQAGNSEGPYFPTGARVEITPAGAYPTNLGLNLGLVGNQM